MSLRSLFALALLLASTGGAGACAPSRPPNIVLIISDDQAWTDFGFMGHPVITTPHLDALAEDGVLFDRGYVPTALCRPSLATIVTGLHAHQHGIVGNDPYVDLEGASWQEYWAHPRYRSLNARLQDRIEAVPTLPRLLAERGYRSFQSGKWWEGSYQDGGFTSGMTHGDPDRGGRHGDEGLTIGREGLQPIFDFIAEGGSAPFFVWYAPFLPHTPHDPPARYLKKYEAPGRPLELARYYAMCEWFDETVGELLAHLDDIGRGQDTLVVLVTDNGWIQGTEDTDAPEGWTRPFAPRSKQSPYDGGVRTPIVLRWPGVIEPSRHEGLVSSVDLAPTILAAAGLDPAPDMPGVNLLDIARGRALDRQAVLGEGFAHDIVDIDAPARGLLYRWCVEGRYKLILTYAGEVGRNGAMHPQTGSPVELFDLEEDPFETVNRADEHPDVVRRLAKRLASWWPASPSEASLPGPPGP